MKRRRENRREAGPRAIDDRSGFEVPLDSLKKEWTGILTTRPDRRNPQDFVTGVPDNAALPYARPEAPDRFMAVAIMWEDDVTAIALEDGSGAILSEGELVAL